MPKNTKKKLILKKSSSLKSKRLPYTFSEVAVSSPPNLWTQAVVPVDWFVAATDVDAAKLALAICWKLGRQLGSGNCTVTLSLDEKRTFGLVAGRYYMELTTLLRAGLVTAEHVGNKEHAIRLLPPREQREATPDGIHRQDVRFYAAQSNHERREVAKDVPRTSKRKKETLVEDDFGELDDSRLYPTFEED